MEFVTHGGRIRFILVSPSHPGNIGAAARAIKTMGFDRLYVVNPRHEDYRENADALAFSTHATDVLKKSVSAPTLLEALDGVSFACALSGYDREYGPPLKDLQSSCEEVRDRLERFEDAEIAFVFGTERSGLTNEEMELCQLCTAIPANPECDSLNLAQAVQVTAYQLQQTLRGGALDAHAHRFEDEEPAKVEAIEGLFEHLEKAMISCGALNPQQPKFMMPKLRRILSRSGLSSSDVDMLRGICGAIICPREERAGRKTQRNK
ncbi:RNA methyltransferase [uncultured Parasutterella sp.]|uniref:RNA methyltransferase n=1 Tax=uncultured Parasutterella sp. TaxID=1263098 RepID=UPI0025948D4A|nr:RNA methyltransferase [uncultured Parasutterella sp.]